MADWPSHLHKTNLQGPGWIWARTGACCAGLSCRSKKLNGSCRERNWVFYQKYHNCWTFVQWGLFLESRLANSKEGCFQSWSKEIYLQWQLMLEKYWAYLPGAFLFRSAFKNFRTHFSFLQERLEAFAKEHLDDSCQIISHNRCDTEFSCRLCHKRSHIKVWMPVRLRACQQISTSDNSLHHPAINFLHFCPCTFSWNLCCTEHLKIIQPYQRLSSDCSWN